MRVNLSGYPQWQKYNQMEISYDKKDILFYHQGDFIAVNDLGGLDVLFRLLGDSHMKGR